MADRFRWGILATGTIAHKFARGLTSLEDAEIYAVASRAQAGADAFGAEFNVPRRYDSYQALAADPDVDAIYVATPHSLHKENSLMCLAAGKPVLCEKPFTINAAEARAVIDYARTHGVFLMEAMWTRYLPLIVEVQRLLQAGAIGQLRMLTADFGFRTRFDPQSRAFDPALGGGALLDVGIYPLSLASLLLGTPARIVSMAELGQTGVDEQSAMILGYPGGALAVLHTAVRTTTRQDAFIMGTEGSIQIHAPWWAPDTLTIKRSGQKPETIHQPFAGNGYNYEAAEVQRCVRAGRLESDLMPWDETLSIMETMDKIRGQWGMRYPADDA